MYELFHNRAKILYTTMIDNHKKQLFEEVLVTFLNNKNRKGVAEIVLSEAAKYQSSVY